MGVQPLEYHAFPVPRVTGSRSSLKVMVPVPDVVYTLLPPEQMKTSCFSVVPVLFNVGINEEATMAASKLAGGSKSGFFLCAHFQMFGYKVETF